MGKIPLKPQEKEKGQLLQKHKRVVQYEESLGGAPGGEGVPADGGLGEEESGHRCRIVSHGLS